MRHLLPSAISVSGIGAGNVNPALAAFITNAGILLSQFSEVPEIGENRLSIWILEIPFPLNVFCHRLFLGLSNSWKEVKGLLPNYLSVKGI